MFNYLIFLQVCQQEIYGEENFNLGILTFSDSFKDQNPMELLSETDEVPLNSLTLDYTATSTLKESKINHGALSLEIRMERKVLQSFVQIIAPPGLLVVVSGVIRFFLIIYEKWSTQGSQKKCVFSRKKLIFFDPKK